MAEPTADDLHALYFYFLRASAIRSDFRRPAEKARSANGDIAAIMDADRRLSVFYGLLFVVVEGFQELGLHDSQVDALLADPLIPKLKRYRNALFHYQSTFIVSDKHMEFFDDARAPAFMVSLWDALNSWFAVHVAPSFDERLRQLAAQLKDTDLV